MLKGHVCVPLRRSLTVILLRTKAHTLVPTAPEAHAHKHPRLRNLAAAAKGGNSTSLLLFLLLLIRGVVLNDLLGLPLPLLPQLVELGLTLLCCEHTLQCFPGIAH